MLIKIFPCIKVGRKNNLLFLYRIHGKRIEIKNKANIKTKPTITYSLALISLVLKQIQYAFKDDLMPWRVVNADV